MAWLTGFNNRIKLTVPPDNVDNNLTDFPVMLYLSDDSGKSGYDATAVFDELSDENYKRIAVTTSDGTTQCPVEIEYWSSVEEKAYLWTKVPTVYSSVDTDLYFYYDATYSGTTTSGNEDYVGDINDTTYQMVINIGDEGTYDTTHVLSPSVIKESDTSYKMWYSGSDSTNWRILYATSTDGIDWTANQMVMNINNITYDNTHCIHPFVIKDGSTYKMWYAGSNGTNFRIIYATSTNGTTWSNHQMVIDIGDEGTYDTTLAYAPCVIKESASSYKMWYAGQNAGFVGRTLYATSTDGISWSNHQLVISMGAEGTYDTTQATHPCVIKESPTSYKMWYNGRDSTSYRVIYAESSNGITWGNFEMVLDISIEGTYDTVDCAYQNISSSDLNRMWYAGHDGSNYRIMYSTYWKNPVQDVWDSNFLGVWHLAQDPSGSGKIVRDSSSNQRHGTSSGAMGIGDLVDGKVGKALDFDGTDDSIHVGAISNSDFGGDEITVEAIVNLIGDNNENETVMVGQGAGFMLGYSVTSTNNPWGWWVWAGGTWQSVDTSAEKTQSWLYARDWTYFTGTYDEANLKIFVDGVLDGSTPETGNFAVVDDPPNHTTHISGREEGNVDQDWVKGKIDEVRISKIARSSAWVKAIYHSNIDNFVVFQDEETTINWLTDWSKRIKLTIPSTNIDSTLVNFPLAVTVASGTNTGVVFDELAFSANDDFTGTNDDEPNSDRWGYNAPPNNPYIQNNKLYGAVSAGVPSKYVSGKFYLSGDFDIQIDFELEVYPNTDKWDTFIRIDAVSESKYWWLFREYNGSQRYRFLTGTSAYVTVTAPTSDTTGKLRFTRVGASIRAWYWGGSSWTELVSGSPLTSTSDLRVRLYWDSVTPGFPNTSSYFDNFTINTGTVVWDNGHPYRKKIAITTDDGTTQCPVEIERWDYYNGEANLWTKIPVVHNDEDTILYLYYDVTKDDNETYVGDTGDNIAMTVWDDNFVGVYHMAQDPSGGTDAILNSSSNINHGTPAGSMTDADLVDGKIGKGIDFDGTDDEISLGTNASLDLTSAFTYEAIFKTSTGANAQDIIVKFDETGGDYQMELHINVADGSVASNIYNSVLTGVNCNTNNGLGGNYDNNTYYYVATNIDISEDGRSRLFMDGVLNVTSSTSITDINSLAATPTNIGERYNAAGNIHMAGILDEIRISDIKRSDAWIKTTYYSNWNDLIIYGTEETPPTHYYYGYIMENTVTPAERTVRLYLRNTGALMDETISQASDGYYYLTTTVSGEHFVVCFDDDAGIDYNALILDKLLPRGIE